MDNQLKAPRPDELKSLRESLGLTQKEAASLVHVDSRTWQKWEASEELKNHRKIHLAFYELFLIKSKRANDN
jgi:DNA-binding transcriptional regulator YiaG